MTHGLMALDSARIKRHSANAEDLHLIIDTGVVHHMRAAVKGDVGSDEIWRGLGCVIVGRAPLHRFSVVHTDARWYAPNPPWVPRHTTENQPGPAWDPASTERLAAAHISHFGHHPHISAQGWVDREHILTILHPPETFAQVPLWKATRAFIRDAPLSPPRQINHPFRDHNSLINCRNGGYSHFRPVEHQESHSFDSHDTLDREFRRLDDRFNDRNQTARPPRKFLFQPLAVLSPIQPSPDTGPRHMPRKRQQQRPTPPRCRYGFSSCVRPPLLGLRACPALRS